MDSQIASWNTFWSFSIAPLNWLLRLFGWTLAWSPMWDGPGWKWCIQRTKPKQAGQYLRYIQSETYWFRRKSCWALAFEWSIGTSGRSLRLTLGIPLIFTHYVKLAWAEECWFKRLLRSSYEGVEYGLRIDKYALSWLWRQNEHSYARDGSTGFQYRLSWDSFRERPKILQRTLWSKAGVAFTQPAYRSRPASDHTIDLEVYERDVQWRRPWNRRRNHGPDYGVKLSLKKPPMFSGKGESGYDCDDDGLYGVTITLPPDLVEAPMAVIIHYAVDRYIAMVDANRKKYG